MNGSPSGSVFSLNDSSRPTATPTDSPPFMSSLLGGILSGHKSSLQMGILRTSPLSSSSQKAEGDAVSIANDSHSQAVSPPPIQRQSSLRSKLPAQPTLETKPKQYRRRPHLVFCVYDRKPDQPRAARRGRDAPSQGYGVRVCAPEFRVFPRRCCVNERGFWDARTRRLR